MTPTHWSNRFRRWVTLAAVGPVVLTTGLAGQPASVAQPALPSHEASVASTTERSRATISGNGSGWETAVVQCGRAGHRGSRQGPASSRGWPPERSWLVRLRRSDRSVIVAIGLWRQAAERFAAQVTGLLGPVPASNG